MAPYYINERGCTMATVDVKGKTIEVDEDGFLANLDDWSMDVASYFAQVEGIDMTEQHWEVVNFQREQYREHGHTPNFRNMLKGLAADVLPGCDSKALYDLFPTGPAKQGAKVAGLPQPLGKGGY